MNITNLIPKVTEEETTPLVAQLLEVIQLFREEIQNLNDEIARLKGQKPKPKIKPSNLDKDSHKDGNGDKKSSRRAKKRRLKI
jgi:hypothetical protein